MPLFARLLAGLFPAHAFRRTGKHLRRFHRGILGVGLVATLAACGGTPPRPEAPASADGTARTAPAAPASTTSAPPAAPTAAPRAEQPSETPINEENSIFFAFGASTINAAGEQKIRQHAARLKANPKLEVTLVGHTDNLGSSAYNLAIAEQRTAAVARLLLANGARRTQIRQYGIGDEKATNCETATCRQQMRRVDLIYAE